MRLAICDDCKEDRRRVQDILKNCLPGGQTEVVEYENGHTLLEHADRYDVLYDQWRVQADPCQSGRTRG